MKPSLIRWIPAILWASVIFATSCTFVPSKRFVRAVATRSYGHLQESDFQVFWEKWCWVFVKGYHVLEFFLLTLFLWRGFRKTCWAALTAAAYAASDEYHQTFVPSRGGRVTDVLIDCIGVTLATLVIHVILNRRRINEGAS